MGAFLQNESRAVMIIGSNIPPPQPPAGVLAKFFFSKKEPPRTVSQMPASLSEDDHKILTELGLPREQWNNLNTLLALYNKSEDVFSVQVSRPGMELSRSYILEQIQFLLENSAKKTRGGKFLICF